MFEIMRDLDSLRLGIFQLFKDFDFSGDELQEALRSLKYRQMHSGDVLFLKGEGDRREAYLLLEGQVAVCAGRRLSNPGPRENLLKHHQKMKEVSNSF